MGGPHAGPQVLLTQGRGLDGGGQSGGDGLQGHAGGGAGGGPTDAAFRQICSELGAGLTCTELVSAKALCYQDKKSRQLLRPLYGSAPRR